MDTALDFVLPSLSRRCFCHDDSVASDSKVYAYTDEALFASVRVRIAFTERTGGVSKPPFDSLNVGAHVNDDIAAVQRNRSLLLAATGFAQAQLIVPNQVHGTHIITVGPTDEPGFACAQAAQGADALLVDRAQVAALLCYADCMPVILVAPSGAFAVIHAGWRGIYKHIVVKTLHELCATASCDPGSCNVYMGAYIHAECFEVGKDLARKFANMFGTSCTPDQRHVDMGAALRVDLALANVSPLRIADVGICTKCANDRFFSYRVAGGVCGRHGAFAVRET